MTHDHAPGESCPKCWAELSTPLFCESCKELMPASAAGSPFRTLGIDPAFPVDKMSLRKRMLSLSRQLHPDFHRAASVEARARAEEGTAELNSAFELLMDDFKRADWLVKSLGGPTEKDERQMPPEFLTEVLEWNEAIEDARAAARGSDEREALGELAAHLRGEREAAMAAVSNALTPLPHTKAPELVEVRKRLNAVRYLDRALHEIDELLLDLDPAH